MSDRTLRFFRVWILAVSLGSLPVSTARAVEVIEVSAQTTDALPRGKEADGIIGDFVLRNAKIEALVSGNLPDRKANMSVHYHAPTPGCLYDLSVRGSDNDQLTFLGPGGLSGPVSYVKTIEADESLLGVPGVRVVRTAALGAGKALQHDYLLGDGWPHLAIISVYRNEGPGDWEVRPGSEWKQLSGGETVDGIVTGDAMNPTDRQGYAAQTSEWSGELRLGAPAGPRILQPGEEATYLTVVAPGRSPAHAYGQVHRLKGETGTLIATIRDADGPVTSATVRVAGAGKPALRAYTDDKGELELSLPPGDYDLEVRDLGRPTGKMTAPVKSGESTALEIELEPAARVRLEVTDSSGQRIPCKVQFQGRNDTRDPEFGVPIQARGCHNIYMSPSGAFTQQVDPGDYRLIITRGIEYSHDTWDITAEPGKEVFIKTRLERLVDTTGWISTDFHNHSTPSGDNYCGTDDRVINLAVEQVEFAPTTEHNRLYDWGPHIRRLELTRELRTVVGIELTGPNAHFNAFPLQASPHVQDGGGPRWQQDPRICAIVLRDFQGGGPFRWVQLNHPDVGKFFRDRNGDGAADGGYRGLDMLIDAAEVWSLNILEATPRIRRTVRGKVTETPNNTFAWLQLLNQGIRMNCVAVSDAHAVFGNSVGGWRTYVRSSKDQPDQIDVNEIIRNSKAGRMFFTTGPFLDVSLEDGTGIGGSTVLQGPFQVYMRVQCTDWVDIDRVQVLVNGRQDPALNFTRQSHPGLFGDRVVRFEHRVAVTLEEDAHLIVAAVGERCNLQTGYGKSPQAWWRPCAFTSPIYIDTDGHGWEPNGDTLGYPLPTAR